MPIPLLFIGIGASSAAVGVAKSVKAGVDQIDANKTNERANRITNVATSQTNKCRQNSGDAITSLGEKKIWILDKSIKPFVESFERIHSIELAGSVGLDELNSTIIDKGSFEDLKNMQSMATSILGGVAGGATMGVITAFGAYGAVSTFAAASTGTAIASLSGAAATNATLAFLGGGSLAAGGLGVAGGTAVLGGLVAGPALAVLGFVAGAKASTNKDTAYSNLAKANEYDEQMRTARVVCQGIRLRANMFERLLIKLDTLFTPLNTSFNSIIDEFGLDYSKYPTEAKHIVAETLSVAGAIKAVLDTPILTESGELTKESGQVNEKIQKLLER